MQIAIKATYFCSACLRLVVRNGMHEGIKCGCGKTMELVAASCKPVRLANRISETTDFSALAV